VIVLRMIDKIRLKIAAVKPRWRWLLWAALSVAIMLLLFAFVIQCLMHFIYFNGYAANGAFQLMNPLTRLADGQVVGRDFQFFHGAGVVLVHFPLFALFGEGLFGSEMSRWFTSLGLFVAVTFSFIFFWYHHQKLQDRFSTLCLAFLLIFVVTSLVAEVITPSNSLLGVRTTMPVIAGIILLCRNRLEKMSIGSGRWKFSAYPPVMASVLALAVIMGTEHGIAAILAYSILEVTRALITHRPGLRKLFRPAFLRQVLPLMVVLGLTAVLLLCFSSIISLGHPLSVLKYALVTVPGDQFWYFGTEPQGYLQWGSVFKQLNDPSIHPLYIAIIASATLYYIALRYKLLSRLQWMTVVFLTLYGLLTLSSLLGYYTPALQIHGTLRVLVMADCLILLQLVIRGLDNSIPRLRWLAIIASIAIACGAAAVAIDNFHKYPVYQTMKQTYKNMRGDHSELLAPAWKQRTESFQPYIEQAKSSPTPLWSTYASLYERQNGLIHPSTTGCDYIIHCLGSEYRNQYAKDFIDKRPTLVATLRPQYFIFEEWLWDRHADFYEHLVESYDIVAENDSHMLWKKVASPQLAGPEKPLAIRGNDISLPTTTEASSQLIKVTVNYRTDPTYSKLPLLNKLPRYIVKPVGTVSTFGVSLPPAESTWSFLLVLSDKNAKQELQYFANGILPNAKLSIDKATYKPIPINAAERSYFNETLESPR